MTLLSLTILVVSPTIFSNTDKAETVVTQDNSAINKPTNVMVATVVAKKDDRAERLARFFQAKGSPLTPYAANFIAVSDKYDLDWTLLPAITGVESTYGRAIPAFSFNSYGWNNGKMKFSSWEQANEVVANGIRTRYAPQGIVTAQRIGSRYAANPAWASKVVRYQAEISRY